MWPVGTVLDDVALEFEVEATWKPRTAVKPKGGSPTFQFQLKMPQGSLFSICPREKQIPTYSTRQPSFCDLFPGQKN